LPDLPVPITGSASPDRRGIGAIGGHRLAPCRTERSRSRRRGRRDTAGRGHGPRIRRRFPWHGLCAGIRERPSEGLGHAARRSELVWLVDLRQGARPALDVDKDGPAARVPPGGWVHPETPVRLPDLLGHPAGLHPLDRGWVLLEQSTHLGGG